MNIQPGTLYARSTTGSIMIQPRHGRIIRFGRNLPQHDPYVHLAVGPDDQRVSRRHGELTFRHRQWWLRNTGRRLIRLPRGQFLHMATDPIPLACGYTWLYVKGSNQREHMVELFVTGHDTPSRPLPRPPGAETLSTEEYGEFSFKERLVLVALGERYLHYEPDPFPRTYQEAAALLKEVDPAGGWTKRKVEFRVGKVREQVHRRGTFPYKVKTDPDEPRVNDDGLLHNLFRGLVEDGILTPFDLDLLDDGEDDPGRVTP